MFLSLNDVVLHVDENKKWIYDGHIFLALPTWPLLRVKDKQVIQRKTSYLYNSESYRTCISCLIDKMTKIPFIRYEKRCEQIIRPYTYGCSKANNILIQRWTLHMRNGVFSNMLHKTFYIILRICPRYCCIYFELDIIKICY